MSTKPKDWKHGDPQGSEKPRGKNREARKGRYDSGWTPTEQRKREKFLKQFTKLEGQSGNSEAYRQGYDSIDWGRS